MDSIINVNWDTVNPDLEVADYIRLPDGSRRILEMSMLHWYWVRFLEEHASMSINDLIRDVVDVLNTNGSTNWDEDFDYLVKHGIEVQARTWIELTEGR